MAQVPADDVGRLIEVSVPSADRNETIASFRKRMIGRRFKCLDLVLVADENQTYLGAVDLRDILSEQPSIKLSEIAKRDWPRVTPDTDQEQAADAAVKARVSALPVVAEDGRACGCVPAVDLLGVLAYEHREDLHRLAGIARAGSNTTHALDGPPSERAMQRLPWLLVGLLLSAIAAMIMASYEASLQANVTLAFFIPSLVYLADAIGTQTETIAVRALSLSDRPLIPLLAGEMLVGSVIGMVLGSLAFLGVWLGFHDILLAVGVGTSLLVAGILATAVGLAMPWSLARAGIDPAFGSGPFATIIQDILTIALYFTIMSIVLDHF